MSLKTWQERFYPVDASDPSLDTTFKKIEHSIEKWCGLKPENMHKHGVIHKDFCLQEAHLDPDRNVEKLQMIGGDTCALCEAFYDTDGEDDEGKPVEQCGQCPLFKQGDGCEARARADGDLPAAAEDRIDEGSGSGGVEAVLHGMPAIAA